MAEFSKAIQHLLKIIFPSWIPDLKRPRAMAKGQLYRCSNKECRREVQVNKVPGEHRTNLKCLCGAKMKKPYNKPVLRSLDREDVIFVHATVFDDSGLNG
jgi:hypothetical protein